MKKLIVFSIFVLLANPVLGGVNATLDGGISGITSNSVIDISHQPNVIWLGTGSGAAVSTDGGNTWLTYGQAGGLPSDEISALAANSRGVWVANSYSEEVSGQNIPYGDSVSFSSDGGNSWISFGPKQVAWPGMLSYDLSVYDSLVYSACFYGGLIRSTDKGQTWQNLFPSQLDATNTDSIDYVNNNFSSLNNRMFSVQVDTADFPDTFSVWAGSAEGINRFIFNTWSFGGWHKYALNDSNSAARVSGESETQGNHDWLISPLMDFSAVSSCSLSFQHYYVDLAPGQADYATIFLSDDGGLTWGDTLTTFQDNTIGSPDSLVTRGFNISIFAGGKDSVVAAFKYVKNIYGPAGSWTIDNVLARGDGATILAEDFEGTWGHLGDIPPAGWTIIDNDRVPGVYNTYPDSIVHISHTDTTVVDSLRLPGDFVVALGVQKHASGKTIWAGCRPAYSGYMRVGYSHDNGMTWHEAPIGGAGHTIESWDFAFSGDTVYVATGEGLYRSTGDYNVWTRLTDFTDSQNQTFYQYDAPFYAVDIADGAIWAGGSEGVVKSLLAGGWSVYRSQLDAQSHYAYPSPFSPFHSTRGGATIHFMPAIDTRATISIFDFNLDKVKTVASGISRLGGVESDDIVWDGSNDDGELVANGVYFYRIELDSGEDLWGKVVVIK